MKILFLSFACGNIGVAMVTNINFDFLEQKIISIITRDDVVSQRLKFGSAFLSSSWESKIALFF